MNDMNIDYRSKGPLTYVLIGAFKNWPLWVITCMVVLLSSRTVAQTVYPVDVTAQMIIGGSVYLGDFANPMATAHKLNYTLTLQDPVETERTVYFRLTIVQNGNVIAVNPAGFRGNQVTLTRNVPYQINGEDLAANLNINNLIGLSGPNAYGVLNEGITDICLEVIDAFREEPISRRVCASGYLARLQAPILLLPIEGQNLFEAQLNNLVFTWQMTDALAQLPFVNISYYFELREKNPLLGSQDQFENNTLIFSTEVSNFAVFYNELASPLDPGKTYLWRVTARLFDDVGHPLQNYFVNNGISRVGLFQVLPDLMINPEESGISCNCPPGECESIFPAFTQPVRGLMVGDSIKFGAFYLNIANLDGSGSSGEGSIRIPFLNTSVDVGFENISINDQFEVTQGQVAAIASQLLDHLGVDTDNLPDLSAVDINTGWLGQVNQHVNEIKESLSLPLSLGNKLAMVGFTMPFDVIITDLDFNIHGAATANLLMTIPGANGTMYNFGATGVRIGRNGFDMAGLKLFLLNDVTLPGLSNVPIQLHRAISGNPGTGSYVSFNCDGFEEFNLQASYTFPDNQLRQVENPDEPVVAEVTLNSTSWGQFTGTGSIQPFEVAGAPGWKFTANGIVMDMDQLNNPDGIEFPEDYENTDNSWRGFYIDQVSVEFPESISLTDGTPTIFSANHILLDAAGVTCTAEGSHVLDISTGNVGGWAYSIDSIALNIYQNSFVDAHLSGQIGVGILDAELSYEGLLFKDAGDNYTFNLSPVGTFGIPFLKLTAEIEPGSLLAIEKQDNNKYRPYIDLNVGVSMEVPESDFRDNGLGDIIDEVKGVLGISDFSFGLTGLKFNHLMVNHPSLPPGKHFGLGGTEEGTVTIPGVPDMSLSELMMLEQNMDFKGMTLPAVGLDIQLNMGFLSMGVGVWAKEDNNKPGGGYTFGKFELQLPDFSGMSLRCSCAQPVQQEGNLPKTDFCIAPVLTGGQPASIALEDKVKVGHFTMKIDEMTGSNSGKGKMEIPFLRIKMDVSFDNVIVHTMPNGEKRMVAGIVNTVPNALLGDYNVAVTDVEGPLNLTGLSVTQTFMDQLDNLASQAGEFFRLPISVSEKMNSLFGISLPDGFDLILLGIKFEPTGAHMSAMLTLKMPGENYMKFGLSGVNLRPDGFNMDGIQIYLAEDFTINK